MLAASASAFTAKSPTGPSPPFAATRAASTGSTACDRMSHRRNRITPPAPASGAPWARVESPRIRPTGRPR